MKKLPTINIKGKEYTLISDRVLYFNEYYKNGSIRTEILSALDASMIVVKAIVIPDLDTPARFFIGHSQATWGDGYINKTSALENAETSAIGRALAAMGIGVTDSIASVDEIIKSESDPRKNINKKDAELVEEVLSIRDDKFTRSVADNLKKYGQLTDKQRESMQGIVEDKDLYNNPSK